MADIQKQIDMIELEIQKLSKEMEGKTIEEKEVIFQKKNQLINKKLKLINILYDFNKIIKDEENNEIEIKENTVNLINIFSPLGNMNFCLLGGKNN